MTKPTFAPTAIACALVLSAASASAALFKYEDLNANSGGAIGDQLDKVSSTYNDASKRFTWDVEFNAASTGIDSFWLVVNNGPNPKQSDVNELAIMYGDLATGVLSTYVYNGLNNANSINSPGILLGTDTFTVDSDNGGFSIDIDVSAINAWGGDPAYTGVAYDDKIGIWFHFARDSEIGYNDSGNTITSYTHGQQGWYDLSDKTTILVPDGGGNSVPEPTTLALVGAALLGVGAARRRRG